MYFNVDSLYENKNGKKFKFLISFVILFVMLIYYYFNLFCIF